MNTKMLLPILSLTLAGCAVTSEDAGQTDCPEIPSPPEHLMQPASPDYLKRVSEWLYESEQTVTP